MRPQMNIFKEIFPKICHSTELVPVKTGSGNPILDPRFRGDDINISDCLPSVIPSCNDGAL